MTMKNPCHPGEIIREEVLGPLSLTVTEAAKVLGVARPRLSNLLNENAALTTDMALRIEKAFGPKMDHLMRMQLAYDLAQARKREGTIKLKRYRRRKEPSAA
jgi:addiction module HigA family antidote